MKFKLKTTMMLILFFLTASPAFAHHLWVVPAEGQYRVARGIFQKRTDAYNPDCVKEIQAFAKDGAEIPVQRSNEKERVVFKTDKPAAMAAVTSQWGFRVNTTRGKKLLSRQEAEEKGLAVINAFFSTQFSKTIFKSSEISRKPLGLQFELVPLNDPNQDGIFSFQLLFEGKPLPNTAVYTANDRKIETDEKGKGEIECKPKESFLFYAKHTVPVENNKNMDYQKFMTFLIYEAE